MFSNPKLEFGRPSQLATLSETGPSQSGLGDYSMITHSVAETCLFELRGLNGIRSRAYVPLYIRVTAPRFFWIFFCRIYLLDLRPLCCPQALSACPALSVSAAFVPPPPVTPHGTVIFQR